MYHNEVGGSSGPPRADAVCPQSVQLLHRGLRLNVKAQKLLDVDLADWYKLSDGAFNLPSRKSFLVLLCLGVGVFITEIPECLRLEDGASNDGIDAVYEQEIAVGRCSQVPRHEKTRRLEARVTTPSTITRLAPICKGASASPSDGVSILPLLSIRRE